MTTKETITGMMVSIALVAVIYEAHRASSARDLAQSLQQQQAQLQRQIEEFAGERDQAQKELRDLRDAKRTLSSNLVTARNAGRAAMPAPGDAQLATTGMTNSETDALASSWAGIVTRLKERLEETPSAKIPELQLLDPADWLDVARQANLDTEIGYCKAMANARKQAEGLFTKKFQAALEVFMSANDGHWPTTPQELSRYFFPPVDDAILQRWQIVPKTAFPGRDFVGDWVLTEKSPVDQHFDSFWTVDSPSNRGVGPYQYTSENLIEDLKENVAPAIKAYLVANDGQQPRDPHDLMAYASGTTQVEALKMLIQITATNNVDR